MTAKRQLVTAFGFSALAHAALFVGLARASWPTAVLAPLALHLVASPQSSWDGSPTGPVAAAAAQAPMPHARRPEGKARAATAAPVAETPGAVEVSAATSAAMASTEGAQPVGDVAPGGAPGGGLGGSVTAVPGGASASSLLGELHRRLAEAARRCYPPAARRFRLQGQVPVHFCLDGNGVASALRLEGTTGSPLLDDSALECVVPGASPLPAVQGCFLVPVHFGG